MDKEVILDEDKRMSESLLWKLQYQAYTQFGISAWNQQGVPFYITSNPYTAKQYAHVVLGYLKDLLGSLNLSQPVYLLDLGAGTGRFAFVFLQQLTSFLKALNLKIPICYILTDIVPANMDFWQQHPKLQPFFEAGILDFAYYHHSQKDPIRLMRSQKILSRKEVANPLILIANYFFDTIPQDFFRVNNGKLEEGRITLAIQGESSPTISKDLINHLKVRYSYIPIETERYYHDARFNALLEGYRGSFEGSSFLFPVGALQSLNYFESLSKGHMLLLAGDQGVCTPSQISLWGEPKIALHGTFSIPVSYHAISLYFKHLGGTGLLTLFPDPAFVVMAGILGREEKYAQAQGAFQRHLGAFEPVDYWKLTTYIEKEAELEPLLLLLKLGDGDPMNLNAFFPRLRLLIPKASAAQKKRLLQAIERTWVNFYPVDRQEGHFVLNLGVLCFDLGDYSKALFYFERSLDMTGNNAMARQNIEACKKKIERK